MNFVLTIMSFLSSLFSHSVSPVTMGILDAKTDEQRYEILYKAHKKAIERGVLVDYSGIDTLRLTVKKGAQSIPLGDNTDFKGAVFIVHSEDNGNFYLFTMSDEAEPVSIKDHSLFDNGDFRSIPSLRSGQKMLILEDENPWIFNRRGFNYGMNRRDILLLNKGIANNATCTTYNNAYTKPVCKYITLNKKQKTFSNLEFHRTASSTSKTFIVKFENQYNVRVYNIKLFTPECSGLYGDVAISFFNCARVSVENVTIDGTYSHPDKYGYGISMNNVYDSDFNRIEGSAPWGVFGNNNVNKSTLRNSHVNRYDVHCYGRDITMENCLFDHSGFSYSSIFGSVTFRNCIFTNVFPCLNRLDFNAYTPFDIFFEGCTFNLDAKHYALVNLSNVDDIINHRQELSEKSIPNVAIRNSTFNLASDVKYLYIYYVGGCKYSRPLKGLSSIMIKDVVVAGATTPLSISNTTLTTSAKVNIELNHISYHWIDKKKDRYNFVNIKVLNRNHQDRISVSGNEYVK